MRDDGFQELESGVRGNKLPVGYDWKLRSLGKSIYVLGDGGID